MSDPFRQTFGSIAGFDPNSVSTTKQIESSASNAPFKQDPSYGSFGDYFDDKEVKQQAQYQHRAQLEAMKEDVDPKLATLFQNVVIHVDGRTEPPLEELRRLVCLYGGQYQHYYSKSKVTHLVATHLSIARVKALSPKEVVVKPEWIMDSIQAQTLQPTEKYRIYAPPPNQHGSAQMMQQFVKNETNVLEGTSLDSIVSSPVKTINDISSANNPSEFINNFYQSSRLHHLSTWKAQLKQLVPKLMASRSPQEDASNDPTAKRFIMHVDMDCFFVSVALRDRPDLAHLPVAVSHRKLEEFSNTTHQSMSDVASCNYIARSFGVKNGMLLGKALDLCPELVTVPYEFEKYWQVTETLYKILIRFADRLEAVSCDEAYLDISQRMAVELSIHTDLDESEVILNWAQKLRDEIKADCGCDASCGVGGNMLLARIATKQAKPSGQFYLDESRISEFLDPLPVRDLPGVGWVTRSRLLELGVETCGDLKCLSLPALQEEFGHKTGQELYSHCRGQDDRSLEVQHERKSISAEVNWGIRFTEKEELISFLNELSHELARRMQSAQCQGRHLTLKVMVARPEAGPARKHLGHGICDNKSRSKSLQLATANASVLVEEVLRLCKDLKVSEDPTLIRGLGLVMTKLEPLTEAALTERRAKNVLDLLNEQKKQTSTVSDSNEALLLKEEVDLDVFNSLPASLQEQVLEEIKGKNPATTGTNPVKRKGKELPASKSKKAKVEVKGALDVFRMPKEKVAAKPIVNLPTKTVLNAWMPETASQMDQETLAALPDSLRLEILNSLKPSKREQEAITLSEGDDDKIVPEPEPKIDCQTEPHCVPNHGDKLMHTWNDDEWRSILLEWLHDAGDLPESEDLDYFESFLMHLISTARLDQLRNVLLFMKSHIPPSWQPIWSRWLERVQTEMLTHFGGQLLLET